jgi:hypothetical protein
MRDRVLLQVWMSVESYLFPLSTLICRLTALWDAEQSRCSSNPRCELWDEDLLLDLRERDREAVIEAQERRAVPALVHPPPPPYAPPPVNRGEFAWLSDPGYFFNPPHLIEQTVLTL